MVKPENLVTLQLGNRRVWATVSDVKDEYIDGIVVYDETVMIEQSLLGSPIVIHKSEVDNVVDFDEWYRDYCERKEQRSSSKIAKMIERLKI